MGLTPRTCWKPLAASLISTFALSFGLTFRSDHFCYAGTCGSHLFPLQARLHVVVWYCWLAISVTFLVVRSRHAALRRAFGEYVSNVKVPLLGKKLALGPALVILWLASLYGIIVGIWWIKLKDYFESRGVEGGVFDGNAKLAAIALTGHLCDVTMGMAILPVSRHSALASLLKLSVATTLTFHMLTAYTLFALVLIHGLLYVSWVPVFQSLSQSAAMTFPVLNPTYLYNETWPGSRSSLGIWRASLIFTGIVPAFIMLLIFITTWPAIRKAHFNLFYFTHLLAIAAIVIVCLHASTMFYCTSPGLAMWLLDWSLRLHELRQPLSSNIKALGKGWYLLSVPLPRRRLHGCAKRSPLAHFYIHHAESSLRELHPFCSATCLSTQNAATHPDEDALEIRFLFRKRGEASNATTMASVKPDATRQVLTLPKWKLAAQPRPQWTSKLAGFATEPASRDSNDTSPMSPDSAEKTVAQVPPKGDVVMLRLEGPYFTPAEPAIYDTVVCIVAGTGVSGALAIASAFKGLDQSSLRLEDGQSVHGTEKPFFNTSTSPPSVEMARPRGNSIIQFSEQTRTWRRCIVVWTVREDHYIDLPEFTGVPTPGFELRVHLTGKGRTRLDAGEALDAILSDGNGGEQNNHAAAPGRRTWVYLSGPNAFISAGEVACRARHSQGVECYGARWDI